MNRTHREHRVDHLVIGGGAAGVAAAETLRAEGASGRVVLISGEPGLPYHRPSLSKRYIASANQSAPRPLLTSARLRELGIELMTGRPVQAVSVKHRRVRISAHGAIHYRKLLIATGATPCALNLPGADLQRVHYLHTFADAQQIRQSACLSKTAVVIGGSFLGLEIAAALRSWGLEVTLIERHNVMESVRNPGLSEFIRQRLESRGVRMRLGDMPSAFLGKVSVEAVQTHRGLREHCDMVVIAAGVTPATDFLRGSGIKVADGVVVDRFLQTNHAGVFAAGDVASFFDPVFNCRRRIEHWDHAIKQGRLAARNMLGHKLPYDDVSVFFSDVFDLSFNVVGMITDGLERIDRGSLATGKFASFYMQDNVPRALFSFGRPSDETLATGSLIRHRVRIGDSKVKLRDPSFSLLNIPTQTVLILQGGGAYGAFECGAVRALQQAGIRADIVAGVSIGAFNGAIVAGNPDRPSEALTAFWNDIAIKIRGSAGPELRRWLASAQVALFGLPELFTPRWLSTSASQPLFPNQWTSFYDLSPAASLLERYVDFNRLNASPIRLIISAVDIESSELVAFDSYIDNLTAQHVVASGSLPPSFSWATVEGRHYWDGGIVSNSPLELVLERCGSAGKRVFVVDLFSAQRRGMPENLSDVMLRRDEILYAERIRNDMRTRDRVREFQRLVDEIIFELPQDVGNRIQHRPQFIQLMGQEAPMTVTRIVRKRRRNEALSSDFDFAQQSLQDLIAEGYETTRRALSVGAKKMEPPQRVSARCTRRR